MATLVSDGAGVLRRQRQHDLLLEQIGLARDAFGTYAEHRAAQRHQL